MKGPAQEKALRGLVTDAIDLLLSGGKYTRRQLLPGKSNSGWSHNLLGRMADRGAVTVNILGRGIPSLYEAEDESVLERWLTDDRALTFLLWPGRSVDPDLLPSNMPLPEGPRSMNDEQINIAKMKTLPMAAEASSAVDCRQPSRAVVEAVLREEAQRGLDAAGRREAAAAAVPELQVAGPTDREILEAQLKISMGTMEAMRTMNDRIRALEGRVEATHSLFTLFCEQMGLEMPK